MTSWLLNCMSRSMKASIPYTAFTTLSSCCATFRKIRREPQNPLYINAVKDLAPWIQPLRVQLITLAQIKIHLQFPCQYLYHAVLFDRLPHCSYLHQFWCLLQTYESTHLHVHPRTQTEIPAQVTAEHHWS